jgi:hypothetical protein
MALHFYMLMMFVPHRIHTTGFHGLLRRYLYFECVDEVRTSQEAHLPTPTACYGDRFTFFFYFSLSLRHYVPWSCSHVCLTAARPTEQFVLRRGDTETGRPRDRGSVLSRPTVGPLQPHIHLTTEGYYFEVKADGTLN